MLCARCGLREALPEAMVRSTSLEFKTEIPAGLCIGCLLLIPNVATHFRARREALERKLKSPLARLRELADQSLEFINRIVQRPTHQEKPQAQALDQDFERFLKTRGTGLQSLNPFTGLEAMLAFYRDVRVEGSAPSGQADMLLYQWGTYDWGQGRHFEVDITRQLVFEPEDENIWQLSLTFRFPTSESLQALGSGNRWCETPGDFPAFEAFIRAHPVWAVMSKRSDAAVELRYEQVE